MGEHYQQISKTVEKIANEQRTTMPASHVEVGIDSQSLIAEAQAYELVEAGEHHQHTQKTAE